MKAEKAAVAILRANAGVAAVVGSRIYPMFLPAGVTLPAIVYQRISGSRIVAPLLALADPGAVDARLQFTAWAETYEQAKEVCEAVRVALERYRGTIAGVTVWDIVPELDGPDFADDGLRLYGCPADYTISHPE